MRHLCRGAVVEAARKAHKRINKEESTRSVEQLFAQACTNINLEEQEEQRDRLLLATMEAYAVFKYASVSPALVRLCTIQDRNLGIDHIVVFRLDKVPSAMISCTPDLHLSESKALYNSNPSDLREDYILNQNLQSVISAAHRKTICTKRRDFPGLTSAL